VNLLVLTDEHCRAWILLCWLALGLAAPASAGEAYIPPTITGYVEQLYDGTYSYSRFTGVMRYGEYSSPPAGVGTNHAFLKFSLDSLPDSCVITNAALYYNQYEHTGGLPVVDIRLIRNPMAQPPHDAYFGVVNGRVVASAGPSPDGWTSWELDTAAGPLLDSCHRAGVACFGIHWDGPPADTYLASAYGYDSSSSPYLHIVYRSSGVSEPQSAVTMRPEFTLVPNPTRSTLVTVNHNVAVRGRLTLRDVLGRTTGSFDLDPSGHMRLDLRGLSPGVYMATLDAGGQFLSRKLVITTR